MTKTIGVIYIEYINGEKEERVFDDFFIAMREQTNLLLNKKWLKNVKVLQVKPKEIEE